MAQEGSDFGFSLSWHPRYETTYAQFVARNPWRPSDHEDWTIDRYGMNRPAHLPFNLSDQRPGMRQGGLVIGVTSSDGSYHILPVFLRDLWLQGKIPDAALPQTLHRIEGPLQLRHYVSAPRMMMRIFGAAFMGAGGLVAIVAGILAANGRHGLGLGLVALEGALLFQLFGPMQWLWLRLQEKRLARQVMCSATPTPA